MPCTFDYEFKDLQLDLTSQGNNVDIDAVCVPKTIDEEKDAKNTNDIKVCCSKAYDNGNQFDNLLSKLWDEAQEKGVFRYTYCHIPFKILPGQFQFIAQLNTDRAEKRRDPEPIDSLSQPFNPTQFNFTKVSQEEVIFELKPWCWTNLDLDGESNTLKQSDDTVLSTRPGHKVLVNVSPLEYGNILLCPFLSCGQPQRITKVGLRLALDSILLSRSRNFRVGFNSLGAYASVNHLHFHGYYLNHRLYLEHAELKELKYPCMEISSYPAPGFAFVLTELSDEKCLETFINSVHKLIAYLQLNNVPHNLYMMRGSSTTQLDHFDSVRLYVWARSPSFGAKVSNAFNPAVCELGGHFAIKTHAAYEEISEERVSKELEEITVEIFTKIRDDVASLYIYSSNDNDDDNVLF